jgi:hypothetical protein
MEFDKGAYVALAFLSRSYHESVKNPNSFAVIPFTVGGATPIDADLNAPHLFYSRPKGTYKLDESNKILLDFFLVNCTLSENGYKVKADINGTEKVIHSWQPYLVEGLEKGKNAIKLELIDAEGNTVSSPFNPVVREFTIE